MYTIYFMMYLFVIFPLYSDSLSVALGREDPELKDLLTELIDTFITSV